MPTVRRSLNEILKSRPRAGLARIRKTTDHEIDAMIAADLDTAPDMSRRDWRRVINPLLPDVRASGASSVFPNRNSPGGSVSACVRCKNGSKAVPSPTAPHASCCE